MAIRKPLYLAPGGPQEMAAGTDVMPTGLLNVGTVAGTVAAGDDARITGAQTAAQVATAVAAGTAANTLAILSANNKAVVLQYAFGAVVVAGSCTLIAGLPHAVSLIGVDYAVGSVAGSFSFAIFAGGSAVTGLSTTVSSSVLATTNLVAPAMVAANTPVTLTISAPTAGLTGGVIILRYMNL